MIITRYAYLPDVTLGVLDYAGKRFSTVEKPWRGNRPYESCIPESTYPMRRHDSPKFGKRTWEIAEVPGRTHILIHVANYPRNVVGCVGLGLQPLAGFAGVGSSKQAIKEFYDMTDHMDETEIVVTSGVIR